MSTNSVAAITLDNLVALNNEISALARAGVPLDRGLIQLGPDLPGRLSKLATELGRRLEKGQDLTTALSTVETSFPPAYLAVVKAGLRSGNLAVALEGVATSASRVAEMRKSIAFALFYPAMVATVAYLLLIAGIGTWVPAIRNWQRMLEIEEGVGLAALGWLADHFMLWAPWVPLVAMAIGALVWIRSRRAGRAPVLSRLPTVGGLIRCGKLATFSDVLALLIEHEIALPEALTLASDASGDVHLRAACHELAERMQRGETLDGREPLPAGIPPMLGWTIITARPQHQFIQSLRYQADDYRARAARISLWLSQYLPMWFTLFLGGSIVLSYALLMLVPWFQILQRLGEIP